MPGLYVQGIGIATAIGIVFTAAYAWQAQAEGSPDGTGSGGDPSGAGARATVVGAWSGLAAAAAHELGTPLATIQVVTKEMIRDLQPGTSAARRCGTADLSGGAVPRNPAPAFPPARRLGRPSRTHEPHPVDGGGLHPAPRPGHPHQHRRQLRAGARRFLEVRRRAEILHGLTAFVENAVDFAESMVEVTAYYDAEKLTITVRDDGPGFSADVMAKARRTLCDDS